MTSYITKDKSRSGICRGMASTVPEGYPSNKNNKEKEKEGFSHGSGTESDLDKSNDGRRARREPSHKPPRCRNKSHKNKCGASCEGRLASKNTKTGGHNKTKGGSWRRKATEAATSDLSAQLEAQKDASRELAKDLHEKDVMIRENAALAAGAMEEVDKLKEQLEVRSIATSEQHGEWAQGFEHSWVEGSSLSRMSLLTMAVGALAASMFLHHALGHLSDYAMGVVFSLRSVKNIIDLILLLPFALATLKHTLTEYSRLLGVFLLVVSVIHFVLAPWIIYVAFTLLTLDTILGVCGLETVLCPQVRHTYIYNGYADRPTDGYDRTYLRETLGVDPPDHIEPHGDERADEMKMSDLAHTAKYMDVAYIQTAFFGLWSKRMNLRISAELLVQLCTISNFNCLVEDDVFQERCIYKAKSVYGPNISRWPIIDKQYIPQDTIDVAYGMFKAYKQRSSSIARPFRRAATV